MIENPPTSSGEQGTSLVMGIFMFFFGLPFTSVPFLILSDIGFELSPEMFFMIAFTLPFLLAGLFVQTLGIAGIYYGLTGKANPFFTVESGEDASATTTLFNEPNMALSPQLADETHTQAPEESKRSLVNSASEDDGEPATFWEFGENS